MAKQEPKEIKPGVEGTEAPKTVNPEVEVVKKPAKETVTVDKATLDLLLEKIETLEKNAVAQTQSGFNNPIMVQNRKKETFIKMRKWNDKYFIAFENVGTEKRPLYVYNEYNPQTREMVQFCNVILEGESKPIKLEYITFLRDSERVLVKMLKKIELPDKVTNQGYVSKKDFAENGYGMFETMVQVPVESIEKQYAFEVELEDGRTLEITQECIG